ncbi:MFS transporter [Citreimonas sp.]|uniref:MFS transporter n=1 Tax=Citreimonas sp. TaxID=3036715 RepID=UPI004058EC1F
MSAAEDAAPAPSWMAVVAILSACNFTIGIGVFTVVGLIPNLAAALDVPVTATGGLLTIYALAYAVGSPVLVSLTGHVGRRRVLLAGLAIFGVASALAAVMPNLGGLYGVRALAAAGAALVTPVSTAVAAAISPQARRGRALAFTMFGLTAAQVGGLPAGAWISAQFGWHAVFALGAALTVPCLWLVATRVPRGLRVRPVSLPDLGATLRDGVTMGAVLFTSAYLGTIYVAFTHLPTLLTERMGFGTGAVSLTLTLFGLGSVTGNLLGGLLADRLGPKPTLVALCLGQILILPWLSGLPLPAAVFFPFVFVWAMTGWSFIASQQVRLIGIDPARTSVILALNSSAIFIGIAGGSAFAGVVLTRFGLDALGAAAGCAAFAALLHLLASIRAETLRAATYQRQSAGMKR